MAKRRKRKAQDPRKPYGLYVSIGIVNGLRAILFCGVLAILLVTIATQHWIFALAAVSAFCVAVSLGSLADALQDAIKVRQAKIEKRRLKRLRAPYLKAWRASLLDTGLQPNGADLQPVDEAAALDSEDYRELSEHELKRIHVMGLALYQDPREHGTRWIGRVNHADPTDSTWWYAEHPYKTGTWYVCDREFMAAQSTTAMPHPAPGRKLAQLFPTMLFETRGAFQASLDLIEAQVPAREEAWLREFIQAFGHADPQVIRLMPEKVDWDTAHQVLHHYPRWQAMNDAADMPQTMALRMCGLGSLLDQMELKQLLSVTS